MGVIQSSQACVCAVAEFLTTYADLETGYMPFMFPLPRRETCLRKRNVLLLKDRNTRACQAVV